MGDVNTEESRPNLIHSKSYPASVTEISPMLLEKRKGSFVAEGPDCADVRVPLHIRTTPTAKLTSEAASRILFKKSHTCGSLFAKCGCNNENEPRVPLLQTFSNPYPTTTKRSSNPSIPDIHAITESKRFSNPEIKVEKNLGSTSPRTTKNSPVITSVYHNHPEIPYPIVTVKVAPEESSNERNLNSDKLHHQKSVSFCYDPYFNENQAKAELLNKKSNQDNLEYLKYTALAYEKQVEKTEKVEKIYKDFGVIGPMGNGVTSARRSSKNSSSDSESVQQIRKNSKLMCLDTRGNKSTGIPEDYEYLKAIVPRLEKELSNLEIRYGGLQAELVQTKKELDCKETEVLRLQTEIHKLKVYFLS